MIYWDKNCIIEVPKPKEGLRYERYILLIQY